VEENNVTAFAVRSRKSMLSFNSFDQLLESFKKKKTNTQNYVIISLMRQLLVKSLHPVVIGIVRYQS